MSGHTPGPWHVCSEDQASNRWVIAQADGSSIADCSPVGPWTPVVEADANARLIASAPTMYAYIEKCAAQGNAEASSIFGDIHANA